MFIPIFFLTLIWSSLAGALAPNDISAESAILYNPDTQKILYGKAIHEPNYPASMTKIVTAAWALKLKGDRLHEKVVASQDCLAMSTEESKKKSGYKEPSWWLVPGTSHIGLKKGEEMTFKDLLAGMLICSGGDASNVIAEYAGGSIPRFIEGMNAWVKSIGCQGTHFENPHGLFHPNQVTTAYDMALIMKEALKYPVFRELIAKTVYARPKTNKQEAVTLAQTNRMIRPGPYYYPKAIGGKTGYLSQSQNTFAAAAQDKDRVLITVLMKVKDRVDLWKESTALFEMAFTEPKVEVYLLKAGIQDFTLEESRFETPLMVQTQEDAKLVYYPLEAPSVRGLLYWDEIVLPVAKGEKVGQFRVVDEKDKVLKSYTLFAANDVKGTLSYRVAAWLFPESTSWLVLRWMMILGVILFLAGFKKFQKLI